MSSRETLFRALLAGVVASLMGVTVCIGQSTHARSSFSNFQLLETLRKELEIPDELLQILGDWDAIPSWATMQSDLRTDWLKALHENATGDDWPHDLKSAVAGIISGRAESLAFSTQGDHRVIGLFDSTPAYLSQLLETINHPFVPPSSSDPNAPMILDPDRRREAAKNLAQLLGMLRETSYLDGPNVVWHPAVILGTRFIYYHELGHLILNRSDDSSWRFPLEPVEEERSEEFYADRIALVLLILETRSDADIQVSALAGVAFAMALVASQEFVDAKEKRSIKWAVLRMARLQHWARMAVDSNDLSPEALGLLNYYWNLYKKMLREVETVPSPVFDLLRQTSGRQNSEWTIARNHIAKWCSFGECRKVATTLNDVCESAKRSPESALAADALRVIKYILEEMNSTEHLSRHFSEKECLSRIF